MIGEEMKLMLAVLMAIFLTLSAPVVRAKESGETYTEVRVYLYGWEERTRARLTLDRVRSSSKITTAILDQLIARDFVQSLGVSEMTMRSGEIVDDEPRLVIDISTGSGARETYYASTTHLFSEDGKMWKKIDGNFKWRFVAVVSGEPA